MGSGVAFWTCKRGGPRSHLTSSISAGIIARAASVPLLHAGGAPWQGRHLAHTAHDGCIRDISLVALPVSACEAPWIGAGRNSVGNDWTTSMMTGDLELEWESRLIFL